MPTPAAAPFLRITVEFKRSRNNITWHCPECGDEGYIHNWKGQLLIEQIDYDGGMGKLVLTFSSMGVRTLATEGIAAEARS